MMTSTISAIAIAPLPAEFLRRARTEGTDDLGQAVKKVVAVGGEPCRDVLRRARAGEELLLLSFSPFTKPGPYHEYGPVFILANDPNEPVLRDTLPPIGSPVDYLREQFVIRAYSEGEEIVDASMINAGDAQTAIDRFLTRDEVAFLHVRFPTYGCFACRIDRA